MSKNAVSIKDSTYKPYEGKIEFIIKDATGAVVDHIVSPNIIKIFAKEILAHRLAPSEIWDPTGGTGSGAWVSSDIDPDEYFSPKYILFGASYDDDGAPLNQADTRFYTADTVTGGYTPVRLGVGAEYSGGLINAITLAEPDRPLKKVERIYFESSYQPSGTPLLQDDVRAINNIIVFETTLRKEEYNGFGSSVSDFFTITEVALAGGKQIDSVESCNCDPTELFLEGSADSDAIKATANGSKTVTIHPDDAASVNVIKEGDQVKIVDVGDTAQDDISLDQVSPYYLVISKAVDGNDIVLDRIPQDSAGTALTGQVGLFKSSLRIFSHRVLSVPVMKSDSFEIVVRWSIILN